MPPKRRLSKTNIETGDARCSSEDESPDTKKVRWNSATTAEEVDSESEEPGSDRNKVISRCILHLCYLPTNQDTNSHVLRPVCFFKYLRFRWFTMISGQMGAAYFHPVNGILYLLEDTQASHYHDLSIMRLSSYH